jgi:hypothetical protein
MKLDNVQPEAGASCCCVHESGFHKSKLITAERHRRIVAFCVWNRRRGNGLPAASFSRRDLNTTLPRYARRSLAPGMCELDTDKHVRIVSDRLQDSAESFFCFVRPQAEIVRADAPFRLHGRCLNHQKRGTGEREIAQMHHVPIRRPPIMAEYWHIGAITTRLRNSSEHNLKPLNNMLIACSHLSSLLTFYLFFS